jgi:hypothetical protein
MTETAKPLTAERERLPNRRAHTLPNIEAGGFRYVAGVGYCDDGRLAEIFLNAEKGGSATSTVLTPTCYGARLRNVVRMLQCVFLSKRVTSQRKRRAAVSV